jgi:hypothetical protein
MNKSSQWLAILAGNALMLLIAWKPLHSACSDRLAFQKGSSYASCYLSYFQGDTAPIAWIIVLLFVGINFLLIIFKAKPGHVLMTCLAIIVALAILSMIALRIAGMMG